MSATSAETTARSNKILVLVIDMDDDISVTGIPTPIVGEDKVLEAATRFGILRPEDSDLNALYAGIKIYREFKERGRDVEIAVVSGSADNELEAELRIREQLEYLSKKLDVTGAVLVTDGVYDEQIIPVIQSILPVVGVKRVIVEQSTSVEETYVLIGRYIKRALTEPRFSKWFLGVPGLIITIIALFSLLGLLQHAAIATMLLLGTAMLVRGFNLEDKIVEFWASSPIMFISSTLATVTMAVAIAIGYSTLVHAESINWRLLGFLIDDIAPIAGLSVFIVLVGRIVDKILRRHFKLTRDLVGIVIVVIAVLSFDKLASSLQQLPETPTPGEVSSLLLSSGFIEVFLGGIAVAGAMVFVLRFIERRLGISEEHTS